MKKIVIFQDYGKEYIYDATLEEDFLKACLVMFKDRWTRSKTYYFRKPQPLRLSETEKQYMSLTEEQLIALPDNVRNDIRKTCSRITSELTSVQKQVDAYEKWFTEGQTLMALPTEEAQIARTIIFNNGTSYEKKMPSVEWLLRQRAGFHGEQYRVVTLDSF